MKPKLVLMVVVLSFLCPTLDAKNKSITYGQFINWVKNGKITSVTLKSHLISGNYKEPNSVLSYECYALEAPANDPLLLDLLRDQNIPIETRELKPDASPFVGIFGLIFIVIPIIMLILLFRINKRVKKLLDYRDPYAKPLKDLT